MNVGSLFSGIGGIDLGLERAGMRVVWQCEADPWRRTVLRSHWPDVPCYEDVRSVGAADVRLAGGRGERQELGWEGAIMDSRQARNGTGAVSVQDIGGTDPVDLLCGGFPCQDLSVAGRRAGLQGERSSLFFEFARVADALRPRWLLIENVPGLLSSNGGRDFAVVLATLAELGYGVAWRVLDSRHFGVPQRRRRVFVVGHLGADGPEPFLPFLEGGEGDSAESGEVGEDVAVASLSGLGSGGPDDNDGQGGRLVTDVAYALRKDPGGTGQGHNTNYVAAPLMSGAGPHGRAGHRLDDNFIAAPLSHGSNPNSNAAGRRREDDENLVAFVSENQRAEVLETPYARQLTSGGGKAGQGYPAVRVDQAVRRLTPTECCRLQGFPDDWLGPPNEKPDSPRYAALGDAVTVPVAEWIGRRILQAHSSETGATTA